MIGTAQFGMPYGIKEHPDIPDDNQLNDLLNFLWDNGVRWLDTAEGYGKAEQRIGTWHQYHSNKRFNICTKVTGLDHSSRKDLLQSAKRHVIACCNRLNVTMIDILLWHSADEYLSDPLTCQVIMKELQKEGLIKLWGVSAYPFHNLMPMLSSEMDMIQLPFNILDSRLIDNGVLKAFHSSGIKIYARSVLLQGLLTRSTISPDNKLSFCIEALRKYQNVCHNYKRCQGQMAIDYVLSFPEICGIVLGCRSLDQFQTLEKWINSTVVLPSDCIKDINNIFRQIDPKVITPTMW